ASGGVDAAAGHLSTLRALLVAAGSDRVMAVDEAVAGLAGGADASARRVAMVDLDTGLGNERALEADLSAALALADRTGSAVSALVFEVAQASTDADAATTFAFALSSTSRNGDRSYRIG